MKNECYKAQLVYIVTQQYSHTQPIIKEGIFVAAENDKVALVAKGTYIDKWQFSDMEKTPEEAWINFANRLRSWVNFCRKKADEEILSNKKYDKFGQEIK